MAQKSPDTLKEFGKYQLIAQLAVGGMAEIFLANQTSLAGFEKLIVIKRILPNLARDDRFVEMFLDEARIAATLNHPNVIQIFDLGRINDQYFIAMEYLSGESLSMTVKTCRRRKTRLPSELAAGIVLQAAEGLHHAHTMQGKDGLPLNIVHRDVSPQNIFILYDGGVKVVDFGIAKAVLRTTQTRTGTLKGKYAYMSPEQVLSEELDGRSDVFALGIILWECLTSRKLFRQESDLNLLKSITEKDAPSPLTVNPSLPESLVEITLKALARDRNERYQSADELRAALRGYLNSVAEEADTVAIGSFMKETFAERIKDKRRLIDSAQSSDQELCDHLFGELKGLLSDTEASMPHATPSGSIPGETKLRGDKRKLWPYFSLVALLMVIIASGTYLITKNAGDSSPADAGLATAIHKPDAGPGEEPTDLAFDLSTTNPKLEDAPDAGLPLAPDGSVKADKKKPKKILRKKKKRKKRRRKVALVKDPPKPPKEKLPPGKLRLITTPWTDIYFKGRKLGQTPLIDVELPAGLIKLKAVNKDAGIDKTITIKILSGKRINKRFNFF